MLLPFWVTPETLGSPPGSQHWFPREKAANPKPREVDIAGTLTKVNLDLAGAPSKGDPVAKPGESLGRLAAAER